MKQGDDVTPGTRVLVEGVVTETRFGDKIGVAAGSGGGTVLCDPTQLRPLADVERMESALQKIAHMSELSCAPIEHEATQYYAGLVDEAVDIARAALAKETR